VVDEDDDDEEDKERRIEARDHQGAAASAHRSWTGGYRMVATTAAVHD
jgi:hypothetical protein